MHQLKATLPVLPLVWAIGMLVLMEAIKALQEQINELHTQEESKTK